MDSEAILRSFHRRNAGACDRVFGTARGLDGRSSYERLADVAAGRRVLDLACGDGSLAVVLHARGHEVVGLDMSPEELELARARLGEGASFVEGRAQELPFERQRFDAVLTHMAFMLMENAEAVVGEIARVLAPGGVVGVVVGRDIEQDGPAAEIFAELRAAIAREGTPVRWGDPRVRDPEGLRALFGAPFCEHAHEDFATEVDVPADEIASFLNVAFYEADRLSDGAKRELGAWIAARVSGAIRWRFGMRSFRAQRP